MGDHLRALCKWISSRRNVGCNFIYLKASNTNKKCQKEIDLAHQWGKLRPLPQVAFWQECSYLSSPLTSIYFSFLEKGRRGRQEEEVWKRWDWLGKVSNWVAVRNITKYVKYPMLSWAIKMCCNIAVSLSWLSLFLNWFLFDVSKLHCCKPLLGVFWDQKAGYRDVQIKMILRCLCCCHGLFTWAPLFLLTWAEYHVVV